MCVNYRNLNEATAKDQYPMPMIDMLVDGATQNQIMSFMDGNVGYNLVEQEIHNTSFICPEHVGAFEYIVLPFG